MTSAVLAGLTAPARTAGPTIVAKLAPDAGAFWEGDSDLVAGTSPLPDCTACTDFAIETTGAGERLRVALDTTGSDGSFSIELFDAEGASLTTTSGPYSMEAYVESPDPGVYFARASGGPADAFRMRAKLERKAPVPTGTGPLLPNLQLIPPYEFTFMSLLNSPLEGRDATSCNPYEQAEYAAKRCLRFSLGPKNVGPGPLMLRFDADPITGIVGRGDVTQLILHGDGKESERPGGSSVYHKTHAHYHHNGFGTLELLRVLDPVAGSLVPAGSGPKQGFCMLDFMIADWTAFANEPADSVRQDCGAAAPTGVQLGLGTGWGDIYVYSLDGNYVEFGENTDGLYVVRSIADAFNDVLETNETDNQGYAYIRVKGNDITVLERGLGASPWDPNKVLAADILPPNA
ncbi:MAG TPA: hypothetical protein VMY88_03815 [Acidimicrobiales bacterium]|nr:hypothetical protein [Acidimicrobiales bacterium]